MAFTVPWTAGYEATPAGGDNVGGGDEEFHDLKVGTRERMQVDHEWRNVEQDGKHNQATLIETAGVPTTPAAGEGLLYLDDDNGVQHLYLKEDDGTVRTIITSFNGPPIGAIVAVSGTFSAANNGGTYSTTGVAIGGAWKLCDGTVISDAASPFDGRYVPKLTDSRFLMGSTAGGTAATANAQSLAATGSYTPAGTANVHTLTESEIPPHTHTGTTGNESAGHFHSVTTTGYDYAYEGIASPVAGASGRSGTTYRVDNLSVGGASANHTHSFTTASTGGGGGHLHTFAGTPATFASFFNTGTILPTYLTVTFYQRIK